MLKNSPFFFPKRTAPPPAEPAYLSAAGPLQLQNCLSLFGGKTAALALAMLAVATHANAQSSPRAFKRAVKKVGYASPELALADVNKILPFFSAGVAELERFKANLLKGA